MLPFDTLPNAQITYKSTITYDFTHDCYVDNRVKGWDGLHPEKTKPLKTWDIKTLDFSSSIQIVGEGHHTIGPKIPPAHKSYDMMWTRRR